MSQAIPDPEILVGIAALGLTVTGFSGLISVLGRRSSGQWTETERFQLGELIVVSLTVTFASFIPILVSLVQHSDAALTTATNLVAGLHLIVLVRGAMKNSQRSTSSPEMPTWVAALMIIGGLAVICAAFLATTQMIAATAFWLVANLLWQLMVAAIHFVLLIMKTNDES